MNDQPSNRAILANLLTLSVARSKLLIGMDTEGTCYRVRPNTVQIGQFEIDQRSFRSTTWTRFERGDVPHCIRVMLTLSVAVTGWQLVKG